MKTLFKLSLVSCALLVVNTVSAKEDVRSIINGALRDASYIVCIDGGDSKTQLRILNLRGEALELYEEGYRVGTVLETTGSNPNEVGSEGAVQSFQALFGGLGLNPGSGIGVPFSMIIPRCAIVAGVIGATTEENRAQLLEALESQSGVSQDRIAIFNDVDLALELVGQQGAVIVAENGSICLAKVNGQEKRSGGLGLLLGDKAGADAIAFAALRKALAQEYGWGEPTSLTEQAKAFFNSAILSDLIPEIYSQELTHKEVAAFCPVVFEEARKGDRLSIKIINNSAEYLGDLLAASMQNAPKGSFPVIFMGSIFKGSDAEGYINAVLGAASIQAVENNIDIIPQNRAHMSFVPEVVRQNLAISGT